MDHFVGQLCPKKVHQHDVQYGADFERTQWHVMAGLVCLLAALTVQLLINPEAEYEPKIVKTTEAVEDVTQGGSDHPS